MTFDAIRRVRSIPSELKSGKFCCWKYVDRDGKKSKPPFDAHGVMLPTNDPSKWLSFGEALRAAENDSTVDGIGILLVDGLRGIDIDHCVSDGEVNAEAAKIINNLHSYTEFSPSRNGVHILVRGDWNDSGRKKGFKDGMSLEVYPDGRYFTLTGRSIGAPKVRETTEGLTWLHDTYFPSSALSPVVSSIAVAATLPPLTITDNAGTASPSLQREEEIIAKALSAHNGEKFRALYVDGDLSGYPSASEADLALTSMLNYWTGGERQLVEILFRKSALGARPKVVTNPQYLERTIDVALKGRTTTQVRERVDAPEWVAKYTTGCPKTEDGNGKRLAALHGEEIRWVSSAGKWLIWDGRYWRKDDNGEIERRAKETARSILQEAYQETDRGERNQLTKWAMASQSRYSLMSMIALAKSEIGITTPIESFDKNPYLLNFRNGTLDLKTGNLQKHNPGDLITKMIDINFDSNATCPRWLQFLNEIMDYNEPLINFLQRAIGYSLTGDTGEQVFFICHGNGANGKSVFLETILNMLGPDYGINTGAKTILLKDKSSGINNDVARLRGLRFVSVNEIPGRGRLDEAKIKEFTGGDTITARFLFQEEFSFKPAFKLWVRTNHQPVITGVDMGMWRRVRMIPFTVTVPKEGQDSSLQEKLRAEWPGIMTWAVMGCLGWRNEGLTIPEEVKAATQDYQEKQDIMQPFFEECCILDPAGTVPSKDLFSAHKAWAEENSERPMTSTAFGRELVARGFEKFRADCGRGATMYRGLTLRR